MALMVSLETFPDSAASFSRRSTISSVPFSSSSSSLAAPAVLVEEVLDVLAADAAAVAFKVSSLAFCSVIFSSTKRGIFFSRASSDIASNSSYIAVEILVLL